ncbi:T9SS type B sorting domain-containing protein [Spongiimicrobium sp. 2-473A-2-J]|uniref:T9SS type B sorting domain-containing protein n=1 Tax=Eudoraea algarum TaxID=3417568 RepID=UPI003D36A357
MGLMLLMFTGTLWSQTNIAPVITAQGDQIYCPLTAIPITTDFDIVDPDDTEVEAFFIQISTGYQIGQDTLRLAVSHPNITTSWDEIQGKLTLRGPLGGMVNYVDLIAAVRDVVFESTALYPTEEKTFSLSIGVASFLPLTGHYYEYVPAIGIPWDQARIAAQGRTYFGLQGYLATITSREEAQLVGEQAAGAGWIGGSDEDIEGQWTWKTGPEAGTVFWNGGLGGSSPNFAFWNNGEPNNVPGADGQGEDYAHITAPSVGIPGSWNDLRNSGEPSGDFQPKGYMMEYGGMPGDPMLNLAASTKISTPVIESSTGVEICGNGVLTLDATASQGTVLWFDAETGGNLVHTGANFTTPLLSQTTTYYAYASVNSCQTGSRTAVDAIVYPEPLINAPLTVQNCDVDGLADGFTDFNLNEITPVLTMGVENLMVTYHLSLGEANTKGNALNPFPFNNAVANTIFARVENGFGCFLTAMIDLEVSTTSFPPDFLHEINSCDVDERDGIATFDLSGASTAIISQFPSNQNLRISYYNNAEDAQLEQNEILDITDFRNSTPFSQTLYVRVESGDNGNCFGIGPHLSLNVPPLVTFETPQNSIVCSGSSVTLAILNPQGNYTYSWNDEQGNLIANAPQATVNAAGQYTVVGTSVFGCQSLPQTVSVSESGAPNLETDFIVVDDAGERKSITLLDQDNNLGNGDYAYALDNPFGPFQDAAVFEDVAPGLHTVYAVDKNGCGSDQITVGVVGVPKFMTPNNDNNNDTLTILGVTPEFYSDARLFIMDRYGKLLAQIDAFGPGWEGNFNGNTLPSSDYWYVLLLTDSSGHQHKRTGHFSLLR